MTGSIDSFSPYVVGPAGPPSRVWVFPALRPRSELQTFSSSGAGGKGGRSRYKHSAPPELGERPPVGLLRKEFSGCQTGAATESRPYRVFIVAGGSSFTMVYYKHSAPPELGERP